VQRQVDDEHKQKGFAGRFGPGLQTHNDLASQLLQNETVSKVFARLLLDVILKERGMPKQATPSL
jgi:hypothetical protein